jgi:hypothetical protein
LSANVVAAERTDSVLSSYHSSAKTPPSPLDSTATGGMLNLRTIMFGLAAAAVSLFGLCFGLIGGASKATGIGEAFEALNTVTPPASADHLPELAGLDHSEASVLAVSECASGFEMASGRISNQEDASSNVSKSSLFLSPSRSRPPTKYRVSSSIDSSLHLDID